MIAIGVWGAGGRMGSAVMEAVKTTGDSELAFAVDRPGHAGLDSKPTRADVVIDFSGAAGFDDALEHCVSTATPLVSGSTGLSSQQLASLDVAADRIPLLWSPNTSYGVLVLREITAHASRLLDPECDVEIIDIHHRQKRDAPSGTALALGESVASARGIELSDVAHRGEMPRAAPRRSGEIGFSAVRAGDVIGEHTVVFAMHGERIELTHRASSRGLFAAGALRAARWLVGRSNGRYDMRDLLD